eukprot:m.32468 g.32468  ORF g.32468 m.32468 type:complete len:128 (-) comp10891_c0_seq1:928-1311(-)
MATVSDLKDALRSELERRGTLGSLKAQIRSEIFDALEDDKAEKPALPAENLLINELIREYLEFNNYKYTSSVLAAESGLPRQALDRQLLCNELHIRPDPPESKVPLLYGMLARFTSGADGKLSSSHR